ncbi:MAG: hypothetical protein JW723_15675 [Bacteroidales bacterium]|nr:hypothetical protein [Bacteroidales bacterium]
MAGKYRWNADTFKRPAEPKEIHDHCRRDHRDNGTWHKVLEVIRPSQDY